MKKVIFDNKDNYGKSDYDYIVVDRSEVSECLSFSDYDVSILVDTEKFDIEGAPESGSREEVTEWLKEKGIGYISLGGPGFFHKPPAGKYTVVYSKSDDAKVGDDPHFWDYDHFSYSFWDGFRNAKFIVESIKGVEMVHSHISKKTENGHEIYYRVYKDDQGTFYGETGSVGANIPGVTIEIGYKEGMSDEEIKEAIESEL